jgi:hypothetical protein
MRVDGDAVRFRTGRVEYANCGIIGIAPDGSVSGGYDDGFGAKDAFADMPCLSKKERVELAEYMICQWQKFAAKEIKA